MEAVTGLEEGNGLDKGKGLGQGGKGGGSHKIRRRLRGEGSHRVSRKAKGASLKKVKRCRQSQGVRIRRRSEIFFKGVGLTSGCPRVGGWNGFYEQREQSLHGER